ncbi:hypothetical protein AB5I41_13080 [Sphingomonas sp. MMS24-JH45]
MPVTTMSSPVASSAAAATGSCATGACPSATSGAGAPDTSGLVERKMPPSCASATGAVGWTTPPEGSTVVGADCAPFGKGSGRRSAAQSRAPAATRPSSPRMLRASSLPT